MNVGRFLGRAAARVAVAGLSVGYVGMAFGADETPPAAPAVVGEACPTCTAGPAGTPCRSAGCATCKSCEGRHFGYKPPKPVVGQLRPGACFGYFQTQWHRWEDVCPLPYQGVGLNDAPARGPTTGAPVAPQRPVSDAPTNPKGALPAPMPMGAAPGALPAIPPVVVPK